MGGNYQFQYAAPEKCGVESAAIGEFVKRLQKMDAIHSFMLLRNDKIIAQTWWKPFKKEYKHELFSCSKSFVSAAFGIAAGENLVSPDDKLVSFFPEKISEKVSERMKKVTMKNLLTMASGHAECPLASGIITKSNDLVKAFLETELAYEPGSKFVYNSAATYIISAVLKKVTGRNVREYLDEKLFRYIGIRPAQWDCCPCGINIGGWGFWATSEDMLRFGRLLLHKGSWNGQQLVPLDYMEQATSFQIDNSMNDAPDWKLGYGYQIWQTSHNSYRCDGACGQYILMMPEKELVMVITAGVPNMQQVLTAFWETVYPALHDESLPENPAAQKELAEILDSCEHPPIASELRFTAKNAGYIIEENSFGLKKVNLLFDDEGCMLEFLWADGTAEKLRADYGRHTQNNLFLKENESRILEASAAWISENELNIKVYAVETPYQDIYSLIFDNAGIRIERKSNFGFLHPEFPVFHGLEYMNK
ncbi:MAG: serine hydrolase [Lentisphaeria bacterium]|nr:serine hydrolase [Lentisphaeria bacterium]